MGGKVSLTVAVTGISGYFGQVLWPLLRDDEAIEKVIGIDAQPPPFSLNDKATFYKMDVRDTDALARVLEGTDVVVHLAFVVMRLPNSGDLDAINLAIFRSVSQASMRVQARKLVVMSSVMAYGAWPDNPIPLQETSPLRPNPELYYSRIKVAIERELDALEAAHPENVITRLRPCTVVGPHADAGMMATLKAPVMLSIRGANPPYQVVHEQDLARAIHLAIHQDLPGAYNVASDDAPQMQALVRESGGQVRSLPQWVLKAMMGLMWRLGKSVFAPEWLVLFKHPLVMSNQKLKTQGWQPTYTTRSAFIELRTGTPKQAASRTGPTNKV